MLQHCALSSYALNCALLIIELFMGCSGKSGERRAEGARAPRRQTYLSDVWTSQPEQVFTFSLMTYL